MSDLGFNSGSLTPVHESLPPSSHFVSGAVRGREDRKTGHGLSPWGAGRLLGAHVSEHPETYSSRNEAYLENQALPN